MKLFNEYNTDGYTESKLDALNDEWDEIAEKLGLDEYTEEYDEAAKCFSDEIASR